MQRALICPPQSRIGPLSAAERETLVRNDPLYARYKKAIDRESAYELLKQKASAAGSPKPEAPAEPEVRGAGRPRQGLIEAMAKGAVRTIGSQVGREIVRGIMGALLGGRRR